jgi:hypothetical protein
MLLPPKAVGTMTLAMGGWKNASARCKTISNAERDLKPQIEQCFVHSLELNLQSKVANICDVGSRFLILYKDPHLFLIPKLQLQIFYKDLSRSNHIGRACHINTVLVCNEDVREMRFYRNTRNALNSPHGPIQDLSKMRIHNEIRLFHVWVS